MWPQGSVEVALGSSLTEVVASGSAEVVPGWAEAVAPCLEDARPNPALNFVAVLAGELFSTDCRRPTMRLVEDVLLVGVEEIWGGGGGSRGSRDGQGFGCRQGGEGHTHYPVPEIIITRRARGKS